MKTTRPSSPAELKTIGFTPLIYCSDNPLFHVSRNVPLADAFSMASDFLFLAKGLTQDGAYARDSDRHAWAAHYLTQMSKALVDDVVKVLEPVPQRTQAESKN